MIGNSQPGLSAGLFLRGAFGAYQFCPSIACIDEIAYPQLIIVVYAA
jgi:hypothetical protein